MKVVCFDLDDTLCDSEKSTEAARLNIFNYVGSKREGLNLSKFQRAYDEIWEDIEKKYVRLITQLGIGEREIRIEHTNRVLRACGFYDPQLAEKLTNVYWEERRRTLNLFPDALPVLSSLRRTHNLSLLTNGTSDWQREKIEDLQITEYFDHIIIGGEVGYVKPNPEIFDILIARYAIPASQILYVGNNQEKDVIGARNSGLKTVWINRKGEKLNPGIPKPHYEIRTLSELIDILL